MGLRPTYGNESAFLRPIDSKRVMRDFRRSDNAFHEKANSKGRRSALSAYSSFAYSALASFRMGMSGSASFQSVRKSL